MGNCQATDAAAVVIQHPDGRVERLYWPATAGDIMKSHPGHYIALVTFCVSGNGQKADNATASAAAARGTIRFTRVRILKHKDILLIGQVYRLITSQDVAKALQARKQERNAQEEQIKQHRHQTQEQQRQEHKVQTSTSVEGGAGQVKGGKERQGEAKELPAMASIIAEHLGGWKLIPTFLRRFV